MITETVAVAKDAAFAYYGIALSDNICKTPEGFVICKDAVIGRTGAQKYQVSSLSGAQLSDLGLADKYRAYDVVDIWRDKDEVFSSATLASFEGKPLTDEHPDKFVNAHNIRDHYRGHVQNVRMGDKALSTGETPILADIHITDAALANDVLSRRKRELSCGYNYHLAYDGQRLSQVGITGNHVAVVARGRAGAEARINDAAPPRKEYPVMLKDFLIGLGLKQMATDNADPEKIVAAARNAFATDAVDAAPAKDAKDTTIEAKDAEIADLKAKLAAKDAVVVVSEADKQKAADAELVAQLAALDEEKEDDEDEEKKEKKAEKAEDSDFIQPIGEEGDLRSQLRALRPMVAKSKDAALKAKFNKLCAKANDGLKGGDTPADSYSRALVASGIVSQEAKDSAATSDYVARLNARSKAHGEEVK